jgi:hypothetical protein
VTLAAGAAWPHLAERIVAWGTVSNGRWRTVFRANKKNGGPKPAVINCPKAEIRSWT